MAQSCIPIAGSTTCPAFSAASISTDSYLVGLFPFLSSVTDRQSFDSGLRNYIANGYAQQKYQLLLGCTNVNLSNTTDLYARYSMSFLCNAIVQNSIQPCGLSATSSRPLCANSCAEFALSEQQIISTPSLCGTPGNNAISQLRSDFTNCALPADSITGVCIMGVENEPNDCGFQTNLNGLCTYCGGSSPNATDSCCVTSNVESRCSNVRLPTIFSMQPLFTASTTSSTPPRSSTTSPATSSATSAVGFAGTAGAADTSRGLSGGAIAGIVIGSVLGAAALLGLLIVCLLLLRRRRKGSQQGSVWNQPLPPRTEPPMEYRPQAVVQTGVPAGFVPVPGGRVARMAALEGSSTESPESNGYNGQYNTNTSSDEYGKISARRPGVGAVGVVAVGKRRHSPSNSFSGGDNGDTSSPQSGSNEYSSPEGMESSQSEQLPSFKDYYSQDEIHPGDRVSTLWAYQPRAGDEFELERGDMLKIVGIWDDGWATGIRLPDRADEWDAKQDTHRDSGVSNGEKRADSPLPVGEIKAFPLVCVCLAQHWRKTIEGDTPMDTGTSGEPPPTTP